MFVFAENVPMGHSYVPSHLVIASRAKDSKDAWTVSHRLSAIVVS